MVVSDYLHPYTNLSKIVVMNDMSVEVVVGS